MDGGKKKTVQALATIRLKRLLSLRSSANAISFVYGFMTAFIFFTFFLALCSPASAPLWFSFFSFQTTTLLAPASSSLSSSSYALPDPNVCASAKLINYDHPNGNSKEKILHYDDVEQRPVDPPPLLKLHDDDIVTTPSGSYQQEPNTDSLIASPSSTGHLIQAVGVFGEDAVTTGESRVDAPQPEDELQKLLDAGDERYNISEREREILRQYRYSGNAFLVDDSKADTSPDSNNNATSTLAANITGEIIGTFSGNISEREREILRQYRYGGNAFLVDDSKADTSPDSNNNATSTLAANITGEINGTFSGNARKVVKGDLDRYGGNALLIDDLKADTSPYSNGNMTSTPAANLTGETNGTFTGDAHKVVKGDLEREGGPDGVSNMTITPTVTLTRQNGTFAGNSSKIVKKDDSDVPAKIQQVRSKRREGRRESRRTGWRIKTAASSVEWRMKTGVNREDAGSEKQKIAEPIGRERPKTECDIFDGRWVRDDSYPHYSAGTCPYVETPTSCYQNGRPDRNYEKWRWQPHGCNIPRLDPKDMLERLRGKRLAFIGDSLNRNMWRSLICLLWSSLDDKTRMVGISGLREYGTASAAAFRFLDYNFTLDFFWSAFLVDEQQISHPNGTVRKKLRLDNMATFAPSYRDADILIFNSGHWWVPAKTNDGKNFFELGNSMYGYLEAERAYLRALMTWADWVDENVNPNKTRVFFRGYSNVHYSGGQWNSGGHCHKEVEPILNDAYLSPQPREVRLAEIVLSKMKTPVTYLNITKLTDYRKDAHPSIYTSRKIVPEKFQDCGHWCLPGVPDTWNELLYAMLIMKPQLDQAD